MIEITGLSSRQRALFDIIWSIEEWDQVEIFMKSLSTRDLIDCEGIVELIKLAIIEEYSENREYKEANQVINRIRYGNS